MKNLLLIVMLLFPIVVVAERPKPINYAYTKPTSTAHTTVRDFARANAPQKAMFNRDQKKMRTNPFEITTKEFSVTIAVKQTKRHKIKLWLLMVETKADPNEAVNNANARAISDSINQTNNDNRVRDIIGANRVPVFDSSMEGFGPKWDFPKSPFLEIKKAGTYTFNDLEPGTYRIYVDAGPDSDIGVASFPGTPQSSNKKGE